MPKVVHRPRKGQRPDTSAAPTTQITQRLDASTVARLDAIAPVIAPLGAQPSRSMAVLACILTGLDTLEKQHGGKVTKR